MNLIFVVAVVASLICFFAFGNVTDVTGVFSEAADDSVSLLLAIAGIMAVWGGFMEIAERSGVTEVLAKIMNPVIKNLFPGVKNEKEVNSAISMNMTANLLGLGNAATPLGIEAMQRMKAVSKSGDTATDAMVTFVLINTASVQLIPATTAMLRSSYGSAEPMSILPAVFLSSFCSLFVGLVLDATLRRQKYA